MNALVPRNRELISRSGSYVRAADGVARGGRPPSPFCFFFPAKSVTFPGVFFIDVIYFQKAPHYDPLLVGAFFANPCRPGRAIGGAGASAGSIVVMTILATLV